MKRDVLDEATRALRDGAGEAPSKADETRARIMASLRAKRARRVAVVRTAVPLAAVFVGSLAWAAASGRLPMSFRELLPGNQVEAPSSPSGGASSRASDAPLSAEPAPPAPSAAPEAPPPSDVAPTAPPTVIEAPPAVAPPSHASDPSRAPDRSRPAPITALPSAPPAAPGPSARSSVEVIAPSPSAAPDGAAPAAPDEHALYTTAHRLHFVERNPGAALSAWDAYLRAAPRGRFSVEARYNRALCLVRLGRASEARKVLEGFAGGSYGGYRQAEARSLIEAMGSGSP